MIGDASEHEQQIREPVEVDDQVRIDRRGPETDHGPLRSPAHSAGEMQHRAGWTAAGKDEAAKRWQLRLETIDQPLQANGVRFSDRRLRTAVGDALGWIGKMRSDGKEILL